ncbi:hypothetical protein BGZ97_004496 [Linnemannia gamsii]|uniref:Uncharacterized protein n=1 Tax=Linnemannia gamsii TaxID=64522 RepID=A0A9P6QVR0_9FUNG|nr:hypothetical protein BGZ97_004496 [Linnemannia gamsii]
MESQQTHDSPSSTVLEALRTMNEFASIPPDSSGYVKQAAADAASTRFLGFERTPLNILFGKTIIVAFFAQFVLFYTIWWLSPSFTKNRRGLAWVLTLCSACWILFNTTFELGYLRTPLWSYLGWEQSGGVGLDGATTAAGNIFSYWLPSFHAWVLHLGADSQTTLVQDMTLENLLSALSSAESVKILLFDQSTITALAGKYLRWLVSLPIFSLAPLNPPVTMSKTAPYFLGGGGRLLISVENFPRETEHLKVKEWEPGGYMYPNLREDFWFPTSFILVRIFYVGLLLHETAFNYPGPTGAVGVYFLAFLMHIFWINKYFKGLRRRTHRAQKELQEKEQVHQQQLLVEDNTDVKDTRDARNRRDEGAATTSTSTLAASAMTNGTFQLRVKKTRNRS